MIDNETVLNDPNVVWYGPHACDQCGQTIVRAALESGGEKFDPPEALMQVFRRGSESAKPEIVYPQRWTPHVCSSSRVTASVGATPPPQEPS